MLLMPVMSAGGPVTAEAVPAGTPPSPVIAAGTVSETAGESATAPAPGDAQAANTKASAKPPDRNHVFLI